jgi:hypothetical protein
MKTSTKQETIVIRSARQNQMKNVTAKKVRNNKVKLKTKSKANDGNVTEVEEQVQSFQTLLNHLATICKNDCQMANEKDITFNTTTTPTPFQEILLKQVKTIHCSGTHPE